MKEKDLNIKIMDYILNCRSVAIIVNDNKILFQKRKQDEFWALPGGKIRIGETSKETIERELKEELGLSKFHVERIHGIAEYFFDFEVNKYHQFIFSYIVKLDEHNDLLNKVDEFDGIEKNENLVFKWFEIQDILTAPIKPDFLKEQLSNLDDKNVSFISYKEVKH